MPGAHDTRVPRWWAWVCRRDAHAVAVGVLLGPLLGVGVALAVDPLDLSGPASRWPTGGVVAQPTVVATPPAVAPEAPSRVHRQESPAPGASRLPMRTAPTKGTARARPTPTVAPVAFANCTEARAAGREDIPADDPQYARRLDRNGNGIGCESDSADESDSQTPQDGPPDGEDQGDGETPAPEPGGEPDKPKPPKDGEDVNEPRSIGPIQIAT